MIILPTFRGCLNVVPSGSYDPDAQAWFDAVVAAGSSISTANKDAVNAFIVGCKADGIWTAMAQVFMLCAADSLTGALVALKGSNPTNRNFVSGDYSRTAGLVGNGSTKDLVTNRLNNVDAQNDRHIAVWRSTAETASVVGVCGTPSVTSETGLLATAAARFARAADQGGGVADAGPAVAGFWGVSRTTSTALTERYAGADVSRTATSAAPTTTAVHVFSRGGSQYANARISWYSVGASLDHALLEARLATLMASLT